MPIVVLDERTCNQIAAGEVIEDCASVVKELVENALDAGAKSVTVETDRDQVRVADDGCGMDREDLLLSLERHATSKLTCVEDLNSLDTLGFRGEALPSIASVAKVSLHSSADQTGSGALLHVEGGRCAPLKSAPRQRGTTIEVKNLFFNVPARKKFQKSPQADRAQIHKMLTKIALCQPSVKFVWKHEGQVQFELEGDEGERVRIRTLFGDAFAHALIPINHSEETLSVSGFTSKPAVHRPNRTGQHLFINGRAVLSYVVSGWILEGYGTRLPTHRYPLFVLHLNLPPSWVDVNVHPQKKEVRLREKKRIAPFLIEAIERALQPKERAHCTPVMLDLPAFEIAEPLEPYLPDEPLERAFDVPLPTLAPPAPKPLFEKEMRLLCKVGKFLLIEDEEGFHLIDTVAARAALVADQLRPSETKQPIQTLLLPLQYEFSGAEKIELEERLDALNEIGISIRSFGGDTYLVDAIPTSLDEDEIEEFIRLYVQEGREKFRVERVLKRGIRTLEEGHALVQQLMHKKLERTPDGKAIRISLTEEAVERWFHDKN